jgi:gluconolactonase
VTRSILLTIFACAVAAGQSFSDLKVDRIASHHTYTDGPVWSPEGHLVFSDVPAGNILRWVPGVPTVVLHEDANGAAGNAFDMQGRLYTCETHTRRVVRRDKKGRVEVLAEKFQGKRLNAPNDIVVRRDGEVYFTDPAFGNQRDSRELDFYGVYHLSRKGELELVAKPPGRPNGIAISPNGKILYVSNSDDRNVRGYDLDKAGAASNERVVISNIPGIPDGIRVDEKDNIYVAAKETFIYSPDGKRLGEILTPDTPSNLAFGDADYQSLYITARTSVYRVRLDVKGSVQYEHEHER